MTQIPNQTPKTQKKTPKGLLIE